MPRGTFFENKGPLTLAEVAATLGASVPEGANPEMEVTDVASIESAEASEVTYFHDRRYRASLVSTRAGVILISKGMVDQIPDTAVPLVVDLPELAFAKLVGTYYPGAVKAGAGLDAADFEGRQVHPDTVLEEGVTVGPGALVGRGAQIGSGTEIGPNTVIGAGVTIGRDCLIGPNVTLVHSLVGDRVFIHAGASIGQDGFGYALGPTGLTKIPQIGRVVIQNDVEIGANTAIDRGALEDTVIGEGTKIDNLVQIAHAVNVGRHCGFASQVGISGSSRIGNGVFMGGQVGILPHVEVGDGAQVAGGAGIAKNVEPGARVAGRPHRPIQQHMREWALIAWLVRPENRPRSRKDLER